MRTVIVGSGYYVPETVIPNSYFESLNPLYEIDKDGRRVREVFTSDKSIRELMGVHERRRAKNGEEVHDMGAPAVIDALQKTNLSTDDLEGIIVGTVTQDMQFPSAACKIRELIGARNAMICFDVGAASVDGNVD